MPLADIEGFARNPSPLRATYRRLKPGTGGFTPAEYVAVEILLSDPNIGFKLRDELRKARRKSLGL